MTDQINEPQTAERKPYVRPHIVDSEEIIQDVLASHPEHGAADPADC
jgi:hypothetical protein